MRFRKDQIVSPTFKHTELLFPDVGGRTAVELDIDTLLIVVGTRECYSMGCPNRIKSCRKIITYLLDDIDKEIHICYKHLTLGDVSHAV